MNSSNFPLSFEHLAVLVRHGPSFEKFNSSSLPSSLPSWGEAVNKLLEKAMDFGVVEVRRRVGQKGEGVLVVAEKSMGLEQPGVCERVLNQAAKENGSLGPLVDGKPPLFQVLPMYLKDKSSLNQGVERISRWIRASSQYEITMLDPPEGPSGVGLLQWMLEEHALASRRIRKESWTRIVRSLKESDVDWVHPGIAQQQGIPLKLLEALLEEGLDLKSSWRGVVVWEALLKMDRPHITKMMESQLKIAGEHEDTEALRQTETASYLADFHSLSDNRHGRRRLGLAKKMRDQVVSHLVSNPKWFDIADYSGRSAFFYALLANPGVLRHALEKAQSEASKDNEIWRKSLNHRDVKGRGIWFYLWKRKDNPTLTPALLKSLAEVVPDNRDDKGNGILVQMLLDPEDSLKALYLPGDPINGRRLPDVPRDTGWPNMTEDWEFSNPVDRIKALSAALENYSYTSKIVYQLPLNEETAAYKALSLLLTRASYCQAGGAYYEVFDKIMKRVRMSSSCKMNVSLEKMETFAEIIREKVPKNAFIARAVEDLIRVAATTHLDANLSEAAPSRRNRL